MTRVCCCSLAIGLDWLAPQPGYTVDPEKDGPCQRTKAMLKVKSKSKKKVPSYVQGTAKRLIQCMGAELAATERAWAALITEQQQEVYTEQVLVDTILQMEEVISFKARIGLGSTTAPKQLDGAQQQQQQHAGMATGAHSEADTSSRYVTELLNKVTPEQVCIMAQWSTLDWMARFTEFYHQIPMLLDLVEREVTPEETTTMSIAHQKLAQVVDNYTTMGAVGTIYAEVMGVHLGECAATNALTMQQEAAPPHHWRQVAERLHLTKVQLLQLAAGYQTFLHMRKANQKAQLEVVDVVSCTNTCSLQLLALAKQAVAAAPWDSTWELGLASTDAAGSSAAGGSSTCNESIPAAFAAGSSSRPAAGSPTSAAALASPEHASSPTSAAGAAAAAGQSFVQPAATAAPRGRGENAEVAGENAGNADPIALMNQLVSMLNRSTVALQLLLLNTLTRQQIARMVVPYSPLYPGQHPWLRQQQQGSRLMPGCSSRMHRSLQQQQLLGPSRCPGSSQVSGHLRCNSSASGGGSSEEWA